MAAPALRALRRRFPDAEIQLLGRRFFEDLFADSDLHRTFIPLPGGPGRADAEREAIRAAEPEIAVILPHSFRSAVAPWRARVPVRIGYAREGRARLLTHALRPHRVGSAIAPVPMHYQYLELVGVLGAEGSPEDGDLGVGEAAVASAAAWLAERGIGPGEAPIALNPGASFGPSKVYPPELLASAAVRARSAGLGPLVVLCGPGEESLAREVADRIGPPVASAADAPPPLGTLKGILARSRALITTDAGPRHLATALGVPSVVLMGPTDPRFTAAKLERTAILRRDVPCGPCHRRVCPLDHRCLREISPTEVVEALTDLLAVR
jgi:heptosyltransferase-2